MPDDPGTDKWGRWASSPRTGSYSFAAQDCTAGGRCEFDAVGVGGYTGVAVRLWIKAAGDFENDDYARARAVVDGVAMPYFLDLAGDELEFAGYRAYSYSVPDGSEQVRVVYEVRDSANDESIFIDDLEVRADGQAGDPPTPTPSPTVTPTLTPTPDLSRGGRLNFQPAGVAAPPGHAPDFGLLFGVAGAYGWVGEGG